MTTDNVVCLSAQGDADQPRHLEREVAVAAVHAALAELVKAAPDQPVKLALELPGPEVARLILESLPDGIAPDEVMDLAVRQASAERLGLVYELFGDRVGFGDDHADALVERGDTALAAAYLPPLLPRLRRPVDLFQKLLERGDSILFQQLAEHQAHCHFDADDLELLRELVDDAASRHRDARPRSGAEAVARAEALHTAAARLRNDVILRLGEG